MSAEFVHMSADFGKAARDFSRPLLKLPKIVHSRPVARYGLFPCWPSQRELPSFTQCHTAEKS